MMVTMPLESCATLLTPIKTWSPALTLPERTTPDTTQPTNGTEKTSEIDNSRGASGSNLLWDGGDNALRKDSGSKPMEEAQLWSMWCAEEELQLTERSQTLHPMPQEESIGQSLCPRQD